MSIVHVSHGLLALYLASLLALPKVQTPLAALVCLTALAGSQWRSLPAPGQRVREGWALLVPLLAYMGLVLFQQATGHLKAKDSDQLVMCMLSAGVLLSLVPRQAPSPRQWLFPAAAVGAIGAFALAAWQDWGLGIYRPYGHLGVGKLGSGAIKFGDLAGMLGLFSLLALIDRHGQARWRSWLALAGACSGVAALGLTQARGGLVGVLLALFVLFVLRWRRQRAQAREAFRIVGDGAGGGTDGTGAMAAVVMPPAAAMASLRRGGVVGAASAAGERAAGRRASWRRLLPLLAGVILLVSSVPFMSQRFADIGPQIERFQTGDQNSEVGQRLVIWQIAVRAGLHAPLTGVGINGFEAEIQRQRDSGELAADTLVLYGSAHNEYLAAFAGAGVPGLVVICLFFMAPLAVGARRYLAGEGRPDAALALVMLCSSFAGYSLTDAMFERQISMLAYLLLAAWLLAASAGPVAATERTPETGPEALRRMADSGHQGGGHDGSA